MDSCLFIKDELSCLVYIDDYLFFARNEHMITDMITNLKEEFMLEPEDDLSANLGLHFNHYTDSTMELIQPLLIQCILDMVFGP